MDGGAHVGELGNGVCVHADENAGEDGDVDEGVGGSASHVFAGDEHDVVLEWTVAGVLQHVGGGAAVWVYADELLVVENDH